MASCKYCKRSGLFLSVDKIGLCSSCSPVIGMVLKNHLRILSESLKIANDTKVMATRISRYDLAIDQTNELFAYEKLGIIITHKPPSQMIALLLEERPKIIFEGVELESKRTFEKVMIATTEKSKITTLSKLLFFIKEYKSQIPLNNQITDLENKVSTLIHEIQLNIYVDDARKAEFKGNKKKALENYYEALYFLKHDEINDSLQAANISELESKVKELSDKKGMIIDL